MREFAFLGTWDDSWQILADLLADRRLSMSPSRWYSEPKANVFHELTPALQTQLREKPQLYIWSSAFTDGPPVLDRQELGPRAGLYFINIRKGGPGLELVLPAHFERDQHTYLSYGDLSYPREIQDIETGEWRSATPKLAAGFEDVSRRMQGHMVRHGKDWVGTHALGLLQSGEAEVYRAKAGRRNT